MKIEFLNPEATRARVTRGWFRKYEAIVRRAVRINAYMYAWVYEETEEDVNDDGYYALAHRIERARDRARRKNPWKPVGRAKLPKARLLP